MPRHLPLLSVCAAAFAAAWWAAAFKIPERLVNSSDLSPSNSAAPPGDGGSITTALDRRAAKLLVLENPAISEIRKQLENGCQDSSTVYRFSRLWAERDPAGFWRWLTTGGESMLENVEVTSLALSTWFRKDPAAAIAAWRCL